VSYLCNPLDPDSVLVDDHTIERAPTDHGEPARNDPMRTFEMAAKDDDNICALDLILAAWDEGLDCGLAPEQMAYAAMFTALTDLVGMYGEDAVLALVKGLERRVSHGEFTLNRRTQ